MLNYLNGVDELGAFRKVKRKLKAKKQEQQQKNVYSQVQKANILNTAIKKANKNKQFSPLSITRIKKQAVLDMNRKNFEEEGEPIVSELPVEISQTANEKFDEGLEEVQNPENLNPNEADSDEGGEEIGKLKDYLKKGGIKKGFKDAKKNIKDNAGAKVRKYLPIIALARSSFLILLKFNVFKLRTKIAQGYNQNPQKIKNWWVGTWGGDIKVLLKNLKINSVGQIGSATAIATAIVSASGVITSVIEVLKSMGIKVNKKENNPIEDQEETNQEQDKEETNEEQNTIEENAEIGMYYPLNNNNMMIYGITKKPITKPKKEFNVNKFTERADKTKKIIDITKNAIDKIFKGKKPVKAQMLLQEIKNEETKTKSNKNLYLFGGLGAIALYLIMKKK
jgi:hypothetical protein